MSKERQTLVSHINNGCTNQAKYLKRNFNKLIDA